MVGLGFFFFFSPCMLVAPSLSLSLSLSFSLQIQRNHLESSGVVVVVHKVFLRKTIIHGGHHGNLR